MRTVILFLFLCIVPISYGQSPYCYNGEETKTLIGTQRKDTSHVYIVSTLSDSTTIFVRFNFKHRTIEYSDREGGLLFTDTLSINTKAFTTIDPQAETMPWVSPYSFCFGDPINYTDNNGEQPTAYEAALMASAIYKDHNYKNRIEALKDLDWVISTMDTNIQKNHPAHTGIGMQSMIFERENNGVKEFAYVYAGTNSWEDVIEDITQMIGLTTQYSKAIENAKILSSELVGFELTFVGHSLGGGEATAASMVTGRAAITFNPAVISPATKLMNGLSGYANVTNYISASPEILGGQIIVDYITRLQSLVGLYAPGNSHLISVGFYPSHSIDGIINALK